MINFIKENKLILLEMNGEFKHFWKSEFYIKREINVSFIFIQNKSK